MTYRHINRTSWGLPLPMGESMSMHLDTLLVDSILLSRDEMEIAVDNPGAKDVFLEMGVDHFCNIISRIKPAYNSVDGTTTMEYEHQFSQPELQAYAAVGMTVGEVAFVMSYFPRAISKPYLDNAGLRVSHYETSSFFHGVKNLRKYVPQYEAFGWMVLLHDMYYEGNVGTTANRILGLGGSFTDLVRMHMAGVQTVSDAMKAFKNGIDAELMGSLNV